MYFRPIFHVKNITFNWPKYGIMRDQQCNSIEELRGRMRFEQLPDPETCERIRYMRTLQKWSS